LKHLKTDRKNKDMRPSIRSILVSLLLITTVSLWGQSPLLRKANSLFDRGEYFAALQLYNQMIAEDIELDVQTKINTGHCYFNLNNIDKAYEVFSELDTEGHLSGNDLFTYASTVQKFGFYSGAIDLYKKVRPQMVGKQGHIDEMIRACEWAEKNSSFREYLVNPLDITTYGQSFGIQFFNNGVVYSSASTDEDSKQKDKQGMNFLSLYYSDYKDGVVTGSRVFSKNLLSPYHVGATTFTSDYKTMYFTKVVRVRGGNNILKLFSVVYDGNDWGNEQELSINSNDFDNAQPAVSPDDQFLYFTSNRPGGYGGKDLYVVERRSNRTYGTPRNLGPKINTFGEEQWPFVAKDNKLYFASDGHIGFGGLDLFQAEFKNGEWTNVENMMLPFNSAKDDFGYVINPKNAKQGFISSNRLSDGSIDAIFYVLPREVEVVKPEPVVQPDTTEAKVDLIIFPRAFGTMLTSTFNGEIIDGADVIINDAYTGALITKGTSGSDGKVNIVIPDEFRKEGQEFEIIISKGAGFTEKRMVVNIMELEEIGKGGIALTPIFSDAGLNELSEMVIPYVGTTITADGYKVLDRLAAFLMNNKHVVIKLNGLTDARGNRLTNLQTSQSLAEKAEEYLRTKGIPDENIIPRSYGERYLRNNCGRGKLCTEEQHLENRRIEVAVWRFLK
jgi:hypothetical protein